MNKEEKFLAYLEALKTDKNSGLLEGVINGFKTLVEYRVDGNISERQVDIMENSEDIEDMAAFDDSEMEDTEDLDLAMVENNESSFDIDKLILEYRNNPFMLTPNLLSRIAGSQSDLLKLLNYPSKEEDDDIGWDEQLDDMVMMLEDDAGSNVTKRISPHDLYKAGLSRSEIINILNHVIHTPLDESTSDVKGKIYGKNSDAARHAKFVEDQKKKVAKGIAAAGAKNRAAFAALNEEEGGTSEETNAVSEDEPIMEVGEGEVKGKLNPALLRQIDDAIEKDIQKMSVMIDRQKLVNSPDEKTRYLNNMRGQKWRDELISIGVEPSTMKGLIPALAESMDDANAALLECVNIMKMVLDK